MIPWSRYDDMNTDSSSGDLLYGSISPSEGAFRVCPRSSSRFPRVFRSTFVLDLLRVFHASFAQSLLSLCSCFAPRCFVATTGSGIFVGFDTGLTAGARFHTCGSFLVRVWPLFRSNSCFFDHLPGTNARFVRSLSRSFCALTFALLTQPTMERTNLDMTHPQIAVWNQELLGVAGQAARLCYDQAMSNLARACAVDTSVSSGGSQVTSAWWSMRAARQLDQQLQEDNVEQAVSSIEQQVALELMLAHQFHPDGAANSPEARISQCKFARNPPVVCAWVCSDRLRVFQRHQRWVLAIPTSKAHLLADQQGNPSSRRSRQSATTPSRD